MRVLQNNKPNSFGFFRDGRTQDGLDDQGELALGCQWGDALQWPNSEQYLGKDKNEDLLSFFDKIYMDLAQNIIKSFSPKSVLDLGCGSGQLTHILRTLDKNIVTVTVDANQDTYSSPYTDQNHFVARTDKDLDFTDVNGRVMCFDVIVSLEHFEHVSPETFETLMANILKHSGSNSVLLFTAAGWRYENKSRKHVHCNVRCENCWLDYCLGHSFFPIPKPFNIGRCLPESGSEIFVERKLPNDNCPCCCDRRVRDCVKKKISLLSQVCKEKAELSDSARKCAIANAIKGAKIDFI